jgi:branched-chain amino acid transport system permease protein
MAKAMLDDGAVQAVPASPDAGPTDKPSTWDRVVQRATATRPPSYRTKQYRTLVAFVVVIAVLGPKIGGHSRSYQFMVNTWLMYSIAAVGFYWVFSLAGRFAFTQTFMMSVGAYMSAWWTMRGDGHSVLSGVLLASVVGALLALGIFVLLRKAQAIYFGIGTLAVTSIGLYVFSRWPEFTGPGGTKIGVPPLEFFGKQFIDDGSVFWLFLGVLVGILLLGVWIERSPLRREAIAGREKPSVASLAGVSVNRHQLSLFMLGSAVGALIGALAAHWVGVVATDTYGIDLGIGLFLMLILGGRQSMWGPVLGAAFYVALPEFIKSISTYQRIVYGVILLFVIMTLPFGLVGLFKQVGDRLERVMHRIHPPRTRTTTPPLAAVSPPPDDAGLPNAGPMLSMEADHVER